MLIRHNADTVHQFRLYQDIWKEKYELDVQDNASGSFFQVSEDGVVLCEYSFLEECIAFIEGYERAQKCEA